MQQKYIKNELYIIHTGKQLNLMSIRKKELICGGPMLQSRSNTYVYFAIFESKVSFAFGITLEHQKKHVHQRIQCFKGYQWLPGYINRKCAHRRQPNEGTLYKYRTKCLRDILSYILQEDQRLKKLLQTTHPQSRKE